jgi:putative Holliday junction resolvase
VKVVGLDLGTARVGVAASDTAGTLATPRETVRRTGDSVADLAAIVRAVEDLEAELVVVGLPLSLDGSMGAAARAAAAEAEALRAVLSVPVETYDERLTTVTADRSLKELRVKGHARRRVVDQVAAAVMLQAWLDRNRAR